MAKAEKVKEKGKAEVIRKRRGGLPTSSIKETRRVAGEYKRFSRE
jgi:hypothetical protein